MSLIVTPRQLTQRSQFYQQLSQLTAAGISITAALEMLRKNPPSRSFREPIREMLDQFSRGSTVADAMRHLGSWVPAFDLALVEAGEKSGRLDVVFKMLAQHYEESASLLKQVISSMLYPAFILHFAIFMFPFIGWFGGKLSGFMYCVETFGVLTVIYSAILLVIFLTQGQRGAKTRSILERLARPVPILGSARQAVALARLSAALEALINAGVTIIEAWEMAAAACGSPAILRAVLAWKPQLVAGQTPSEEISASSQFPEVFANLYHSGEQSGQLDETLRRLHTYYQEEATQKMRLLAGVLSKLIYFGVVIYIAWKIISFYLDYFDQVRKAGGF